jgi:hypothetical protein
LFLDPTDRNHLFMSFHDQLTPPFPSVGYAESFTAGARWAIRGGNASWVPSEAQTIYILDGTHWLFANHADGLWTSSDAGISWTLVASNAAGHWPAQLYHASSGVWYIGSDVGIWRSFDGGVTWALVPNSGSLVNGTIGDGTTLFASYDAALTPWVPPGSNPYYTSPETDGFTWTQVPWPVPPGQFTQGSGAGMAIDPINHLLYSSNGTVGLWRIRYQ